jgi:hypothetical protein
MKTTHFERITTKPVTVQEEVREEAHVPVLDFNKGAVLEVTNIADLPNSQVFFNGVLLKGAVLVRVDVGRGYWGGASKGYAVLHTARGEMTLAISEFISTEGVTPTTVEWKKKQPAMVSGHHTVKMPEPTCDPHDYCSDCYRYFDGKGYTKYCPAHTPCSEPGCPERGLYSGVGGEGRWCRKHIHPYLRASAQPICSYCRVPLSHCTHGQR